MKMLFHNILYHQLVYADSQHIWSSKGLWLVIAQHNRNALHAAIHMKRAGPEVTGSGFLQSQSYIFPRIAIRRSRPAVQEKVPSVYT